MMMIMMTNNPLEQYNGRKKDDFTKRLKNHLKTAIKVFRELINFESENLREFQIVLCISDLMIKIATILKINY